VQDKQLQNLFSSPNTINNQTMDAEVGKAHSVTANDNMHKKILVRNPVRIDDSGDLDIKGIPILKLTLQKQGMQMWTGLS